MSASSGTAYLDAEDPQELEEQIERARDDLARTIDQIAVMVSPATISRKVKTRAKGLVFDEDGELRRERVAVAGGVATLLITVVVWRRLR